MPRVIRVSGALIAVEGKDPDARAALKRRRAGFAQDEAVSAREFCDKRGILRGHRADDTRAVIVPFRHAPEIVLARAICLKRHAKDRLGQGPRLFVEPEHEGGVTLGTPAPSRIEPLRKIGASPFETGLRPSSA